MIFITSVQYSFGVSLCLVAVVNDDDDDGDGDENRFFYVRIMLCVCVFFFPLLYFKPDMVRRIARARHKPSYMSCTILIVHSYENYATVIQNSIYFLIKNSNVDASINICVCVCVYGSCCCRFSLCLLQKCVS